MPISESLLNSPSTEVTRCPRCGYDQRGAMITWVESCPLSGTCSECGLQFQWSEVQHPEKYEPPWCVEFASRWRSVPRACLSTFVRSFWPWGFWKRLKMSHPVHFGRLGVYVLCMLLPLAMAYAVAQGSVAVYMRYKTQQSLVATQAIIPPQITATQQWIAKIKADHSRFSANQYLQMLQAANQQLTELQQMQANPPRLNNSGQANR